ncbi:hypothetical protein FOPE_10901 [Fonsecaea pedrosoi]|nr:hypothetical protein FOPE_10901 [Fonsecaea pedrosoi]
MPVTEDLWLGVTDLPLSVQNSYLPDDRVPLSQLYMSLLKHSVSLAEVLRVHYRPKKPMPTTAQLESDYQEILRHLDTCHEYEHHPSELVRSCAAHVRVQNE